jgi:hypothetical protein
MVCSVDRRLHNRALTDLDVEVVRLKDKGEIVAGRLEDISESGMCLILPCELSADEIVRLETADCTLFGYVVYSTCSTSTRNAFRTGIEVQRVLLGNTHLAGLLRTALQDTMPRAILSAR